MRADAAATIDNGNAKCWADREVDKWRDATAPPQQLALFGASPSNLRENAAERTRTAESAIPPRRLVNRVRLDYRRAPPAVSSLAAHGLARLDRPRQTLADAAPAALVGGAYSPSSTTTVQHGPCAASHEQPSEALRATSD